MSNVTVNIAFQDKLLKDIDRVAHVESRSRSELLRDAARVYIQRKERWNSIFALGRSVAKQARATPGDIQAEIAAHRKEKAVRR